ncbi:MAG: hypothetical protein AB7U75_13865 [Hyphomicrobiaceae bacterium]
MDTGGGDLDGLAPALDDGAVAFIDGVDAEVYGGERQNADEGGERRAEFGSKTRPFRALGDDSYWVS